MTKLTKNRVAEISVSYKPAIHDRPVIQSSKNAFEVVYPLFPENTIALQEHFLVVYVNQSNSVLGAYHVSTGGISGTIADIRLIIGVALKTAATGMLLAHNHPSGKLVASKADSELTLRIKESCRIHDIRLLDHIIVSPDGSYFSFADDGIL